MGLKEVNQEVFYANEEIIRIRRKDLDSLKDMSKGNLRQRARICTHQEVDDLLHEMLIVLPKQTYIRPHKHLHKSESFHIIEGLVDVIIFDNEGNLVEVIKMGDFASGMDFYYRLSKAYFHTLLIKSDLLVFHETTNGPFNRADTVFAPWAPLEENRAAVSDYISYLSTQIESFHPYSSNSTDL